MKKITTIEELVAHFTAQVTARRNAGLPLDAAEIAAKAQVEHDILHSPNLIETEVGKKFLVGLKIGPASRTVTTTYYGPPG